MYIYSKIIYIYKILSAIVQLLYNLPLNSVILGFSFSFEFVIQVKTSVTQNFKSVRDSKEINLCVVGIEMMFYIMPSDDLTEGSSI